VQSLVVPGHGEAVVVVPIGATQPRPVLVATHGNYDRPEWQCEVWSEIVKGRAFVLCPRGVKRGDSPSRSDLRFEYASVGALEHEIDAGLAALTRAFPAHVDPGPMVLTGFSLGALMAVFVAYKQPARFPRLVLIEGGEGWQQKTAQSFQKGGGQRVLFACALPNCEAADRNAAATLRKAGVEVEQVRGSEMAHSYVGDVQAKYAARFDWLVEGDPRW
jgi:pimeloyl-ACP methyl ester carboxylesterase